jgi:hypothetical protein
MNYLTCFFRKKINKVNNMVEYEGMYCNKVLFNKQDPNLGVLIKYLPPINS